MKLVVDEETVIQLRDMTEEEFYEFCSLNEDYRIERTAQGDIQIMPPAGGEAGYQSIDLSEQLQRWTRRDGRGVAFDSSAGFQLPNGATRSPDASWVLRSRLAKLTREQKRRFLPVCPDFVVELTSPSGRLRRCGKRCGSGWTTGRSSAGSSTPTAKRFISTAPVESRS